MYTYTDLPRIPTQVIGSSGIPGWMWVVKDAVAAGKMGPADIDETLKDAVNLAILDMEEAGVDIISDGEMQRAPTSPGISTARCTGLCRRMRRANSAIPAPISSMRSCASSRSASLVATAPWPSGSLLRTRTNKPLISTLQSPVTQAFRVDPGKVYKNKGEVAWALVPYINKELKQVVAAGCTHVQFDEPAYRILPGGVAEMVDIFNACVEGVNATVGFHLCFGNFRGRPATSHRSFAALPATLQGPARGRAPHRVRQPQHVRGGTLAEIRRRKDPVRGRDRREGP